MKHTDWRYFDLSTEQWLISHGIEKALSIYSLLTRATIPSVWCGWDKKTSEGFAARSRKISNKATLISTVIRWRFYSLLMGIGFGSSEFVMAHYCSFFVSATINPNRTLCKLLALSLTSAATPILVVNIFTKI